MTWLGLFPSCLCPARSAAAKLHGGSGEGNKSSSSNREFVCASAVLRVRVCRAVVLGNYDFWFVEWMGVVPMDGM